MNDFSLFHFMDIVILIAAGNYDVGVSQSKGKNNECDTAKLLLTPCRESNLYLSLTMQRHSKSLVIVLLPLTHVTH